MNISEKIKAVNNKTELNKDQYDLDRQTANISALSTGHVSKYEFFTKTFNRRTCSIKKILIFTIW